MVGENCLPSLERVLYHIISSEIWKIRKCKILGIFSTSCISLSYQIQSQEHKTLQEHLKYDLGEPTNTTLLSKHNH